MNPLFDERVRRIIPRWRDAETTARLGELGSLKPRNEGVTQSGLQEKLVDWEASPTLFVATDIIGTALLSDAGESDVVRKAAALILKDDSGATFVARRVASTLLRLGNEARSTFTSSPIRRTEVHDKLHTARLGLGRDFRNSIAWVDLSYLYTLIGQLSKARRAMTLALSLAPDSRYVLRSATRLLVHDRDPERALALLRQSGRTAHDPWLVASEISVAGLVSVTPRHAKTGLRLAASRSYSSRDLSEVTAALGTLEAEHGNRRKARKLFEVSLKDPNENVLAQAAWAARATQAIDLDPANIDVPFSFEARARIGFRERRWADALRESEGWFNDQRFSVGGAAFASYVASVVLAQHETAIAILKEGLVANPHDWTLRNNLAFSLASLDQIESADGVFRDLSPESDNPARHAVWLATSGLLTFRRGDHEEGQRLYDEAIEEFGRNGLQPARAVAAVFKAREAVNAKLSNAPDAIRAAKDFAATASSPELDTLIQQLDVTTVRSVS